MKKVFLLAMLFAATVCNAQVVLWDGTDKEVGSDGGFWNRADPTVVEEDRCRLQGTAPFDHAPEND